MTVTAINRKNQFTTNGVTVEFVFDFAITDIQQVKALTVLDGVETEYLNFTVIESISTEGGTLTTLDVLDDVDLLVFRDTALTQQLDYAGGGRFPADSHEQAIDKLTLQNQDQQEELSRALKFDISNQNILSLEEYDETVNARDVDTLDSSKVYTDQQVFNAGSITPLQTVSRTFNALNNEVISAADTVTALDNVLYIYDESQQMAYGVPTLNGAGETIVSVTVDELVTTGGTYDLIITTSLDKENAEVLFSENFASYDDMLAGKPLGGSNGDVKFNVFSKPSTGGTSWFVTTDNTGLQLYDGLYVKPDGPVHLADFGLTYDGVADDTSKMVFAITLATAHGNTMVWKRGKIGITTLEMSMLHNFTVIAQNVELVGIVNAGGVGTFLEINAWVDSNILGSLKLTGNQHYSHGFEVSTKNGSNSRNNFYNIYTVSFPIGILIGNRLIDSLNSENTFYGANAFECPIHVAGGGFNTGATFIGCNLIGNPNVLMPAAAVHAMYLEGGFWNVVGGEVLLTALDTSQCLRMLPDAGATPSYPTLRISGAQIETGTQFALIDNPGGVVVDPNGNRGQISIVASGGYCGGANAANQNFIEASAGFAGRIQVTGCNFYSGVARSAFNILAASADVETDRTSWGVNFKDWMGGVSEGKLAHAEELIIGGTGVNNGDYVASVEKVIRQATKLVGGRYARYNPSYANNTGIFTVPAGGLASLRVDVRAVSTGIAGTIYCKLNGNIIDFGSVGSDVATISSLLHNLDAGDTVTVHLNVTANKTLLAGDFNYTKYTAST